MHVELPHLHVEIPPEFFGYPRSVGLELSSRCPLRCVMCPQPEMARPKRDIESELALKVIDDVAQHPGTLLEPQGMGELFYHREWERLLGHAVRESALDVVVLTHGAFLTPAVIEKLLDIAPAHVVLGLEGATRETHEAVALGSDFERVVRSAEALLAGKRARGQQRPQIHLRLTPTRTNEHEAAAFVQRWQALLGPGDSAEINPVCNAWTGKKKDAVPEREPPTARIACPVLWMHLNVLEDGRATPCCLDSEGKIEVGNARSQTLEQIWKGEKLAAYRQAHLEGRYHDVPLCGDCPDWINFVRSVLGAEWGRQGAAGARAVS